MFLRCTGHCGTVEKLRLWVLNGGGQPVLLHHVSHDDAQCGCGVEHGGTLSAWYEAHDKVKDSGIDLRE